MKLSVLRFMVRSMTRRNLTDINRQCESFFATVLNFIDGTELQNLNDIKLNEAAIDLADTGRRLCVQVTSTSDSAKIKKTIETFITHGLHKKYDTLQILILGEKKDYRTKFDTQGLFAFDHKRHVRDIDDLLSDAESLPLETLQALTTFVDEELLSVAQALEPDSILAGAEVIDGKQPTTASTFLLHSTNGEVNEREWLKDLETLVELHKDLTRLSRNQREVIEYMMMNGDGWPRLAMSIQTLQQRLRLSEGKMHEYYCALEKAGLMDVDNDEHAQEFELRRRLSGSHNDAFAMLKDFLKTKELIHRAIVDCDFSTLD